jgi:hypothetical protein
VPGRHKQLEKRRRIYPATKKPRHMKTANLKDKYQDLFISLCIELSPEELKAGEELRRQSKLRRQAIRLQLPLEQAPIKPNETTK